MERKCGVILTTLEYDEGLRKRALRSSVQKTYQPDNVLERVNNGLCECVCVEKERRERERKREKRKKE